MENARDRQVEVGVVVRQAGERGRPDGEAVEALHAADDLLLLRAAERVVHVAHQLDLGVVRLRAGIAEEHLRDRDRCHLLELLGELDRRIVALAVVEMAEAELLHLSGRGVGELFVAVTERRAPQAGHALEIRLALDVVDVHALAALDHQRAGVAQLRQVGVGMRERLDVADREIAEGHGFVPMKNDRGGRPHYSEQMQRYPRTLFGLAF